MSERALIPHAPEQIVQSRLGVYIPITNAVTITLDEANECVERIKRLLSHENIGITVATLFSRPSTDELFVVCDTYIPLESGKQSIKDATTLVQKTLDNAINDELIVDYTLYNSRFI